MLLQVDSFQAVERLTNSGMPKQQAKAVVETLVSVDMEQVATKKDLSDLKADLFKAIVPMLLGQIVAFAAVVSWMT